MTVRRAVAALLGSREAIARIEAELASLLVALGDPAAVVDPAAADRLCDATEDAGAALATLFPGHLPLL